MRIELQKVAKRYRLEWIFRDINYTFEPGKTYAITGPNGSGKSTFLKLLSGYLTPSKGKVVFTHDDKDWEVSQVYNQLAFAAPYIDLVEEMTLLEALHFHHKFKPFIEGLQPEDVVHILNFQNAKNKSIAHFSSGMKQRLKLVLALCVKSAYLLLDEPTTNLDRQGMDWYLELVKKFAGNRLTIVASNVEEDLSFCEARLNILDYKKAKKRKKSGF